MPELISECKPVLIQHRNFFGVEYRSRMKKSEKPYHSWGKRLVLRMDELSLSSSMLADRMIKQAHDGFTADRKKLVANIEGYRTCRVGQPRGNTMPALAAALEVPLAWLRDETDSRRIGRPRRQPETVATSAELSNAPHSAAVHAASWPVLGITLGTEPGVQILSDEEIDRIDVPAEIADVRGAYALMMKGESMLPAIRPNWIVGVNPHLDPMVGDDVIVQYTKDDGATTLVTIKRFVRFDDKSLVLEQLNPSETKKISRREVRAVHVVVFYYRRR